jgi:TetR/AcrR family transcriptional regulator of autoinduction and epiphytic fitness
MVQENQSSRRHNASSIRSRAPVPSAFKPETAKILHLIDAAEDIFLAKGYHTATMNDVAKAAGMSKKTVYQLIDSKADLFAALLDHHHSKLVFPPVEEGWTVRDILVENLLCLGRFLLSPQQIAIIRLIMAEYTHSPDFGRLFHQKRVTKAKNLLENCLAEIAGRNQLKLTDAREMSAMLFGMALGEFHLSVLIGFRPAPAKAVLERRIRCAVDLFLTGCQASPQ